MLEFRLGHGALPLPSSPQEAEAGNNCKFKFNLDWGEDSVQYSIYLTSMRLYLSLIPRNHIKVPCIVLFASHSSA